MLPPSLEGPSASTARRDTLDAPDGVGIETDTVPSSDTFTFPPASFTVLQFGI